jgi:hypothetical protein
LSVMRFHSENLRGCPTEATAFLSEWWIGVITLLTRLY